MWPAQLGDIGDSIFPILQMEKVRLQEVIAWGGIAFVQLLSVGM